VILYEGVGVGVVVVMGVGWCGCGGVCVCVCVCVCLFVHTSKETPLLPFESVPCLCVHSFLMYRKVPTLYVPVP